MYEQAGEADWQGNLEFHSFCSCIWLKFVFSLEFFKSSHELLAHTHFSWKKLDFQICLSGPRKVSKGISLRGRPSSFRFPGILQNSSDSPFPFCLSPSGKDEAKTASLPRSFWRTTTQRYRTPSMRAGSWLSPVRAGRGRPPRPSSTRGRPTS